MILDMIPLAVPIVFVAAEEIVVLVELKMAGIYLDLAAALGLEHVGTALGVESSSVDGELSAVHLYDGVATIRLAFIAVGYVLITAACDRSSVDDDFAAVRDIDGGAVDIAAGGAGIAAVSVPGPRVKDAKSGLGLAPSAFDGTAVYEQPAAVMDVKDVALLVSIDLVFKIIVIVWGSYISVKEDLSPSDGIRYVKITLDVEHNCAAAEHVRIFEHQIVTVKIQHLDRVGFSLSIIFPDIEETVDVSACCPGLLSEIVFIEGPFHIDLIPEYLHETAADYIAQHYGPGHAAVVDDLAHLVRDVFGELYIRVYRSLAHDRDRIRKYIARIIAIELAHYIVPFTGLYVFDRRARVVGVRFRTGHERDHSQYHAQGQGA